MIKTTLPYISLLLTLFILSCNIDQENNEQKIEEYTPTDQALYDVIVKMDKEFFDAYNTCNLEKQAAMFSDDIEFFHDRGGLNTSKDEIMEGTKNNICGKVTRILIEGSVEVYGINNYGAIQMGYHRFLQQPRTRCGIYTE